jgi:hypothetical protein
LTETWKELLATRRSDGNFTLPCMASAPKDMELVPSHKRADARRRSALLSAIEDAMRASLNGWQISAAPALAEFSDSAGEHPWTMGTSRPQQVAA